MLLGSILFFLPNDPLRPFIDSMAGGEWLGYLNWFVPIGTMISIGYAWLAAIAIFYTYQVILRWIKAAGS